MKKRLLILMMFLVAIATGSWAEVEPYAALSDNDQTLTFYYDMEKAARGGMSVVPFEYHSSITTVVFDASFANYKPTSTAYWFDYLSNLTTITGIENLKTDEVTSMIGMFRGCSSLTSLDLSGFNTEKVTEMAYMFADCPSLTSINLSSFNTKKVTFMSGMFIGCSSLTSLDLSNFNTEKVENMNGMFCDCSSLTSLDLSSFNTANVQFTDIMFSGCTSLMRITVDPEKWNTSKVTYSEEMFKGCTNLEGGNGTVYDSKHTNATYAVIDKDGTPGYLTDVNAPEILRAYAALSNDNKTLTFYYDLDWFTRKGMRVGAFTPATYVGWLNQRETITTVVFDASFANYKPTSTAHWLYDLTNLTTITGIENLKTDDVTDMSGMFSGCSSLTSLDITGFNTANVTNMNSMFNGCSSLTSLDLSNFNIEKVTNMGYMFSGCSSLTSLDLSSFYTVKLSYAPYMFGNCSALTKIVVDPEKWIILKGIYSNYMFFGCTSLVGGNGTAYDSNYTNATYAVIDKPGTPGYLTDVNAHTHTAGSPVQENMVGPSCTTDGQFDVVEYCTICGEEMSRDTQYIPALGHDLTYVPEVPATTTADGMKEHYTCSRCTNLINMSYAIVTASDLIIPMLVEPEAYAALSNDNKTLTFYYDGQKASRNGMSVGPFTDKFQRGWDNQSQTITTVVFDASFANYKPTSTAVWFYICENLTTITGIENLKTDEVTDMSSMFSYCYSLTSLDLSGFNTSNVTNMKGMFDRCSNLTSLDVSSFNTAKVENMYGMFASCSSLTSLDVSSFNTAKVENMYGMFSGCSSLTNLDLSSFNTEKVTNMSTVFMYCSNLTSIDLSSFNTDNVTEMATMFGGCSSLASLDVSSFNTENVESMAYMFANCSGLTSLDLSSFNTANVKYMTRMFGGCTALTKITVDPGKWDTSKITNSDNMFDNCTSLVGGNGTVYQFNHTDATYAVIDKDGTPGYLTDVNTPVEPEAYAVLSGDGKTLTFYYDMEKASRGGMSVGPFDGSTTLPAWSDKAGSIRNANIDESFAGYSELTSTAYWFEGCSELKAVSGLENLVMDNVTDMSNMFKGCNNLRSVSLSGMNTGKVTNMHGLFWDCNALQSIDLSTLDTRSVTDMSGMFNYCSGLKTVDLSGVNTASVTDMNNMFYYCSSLTDLDLSSFNTGSVTNMRYMFEGCSSLTKITVSETGWTTNAVTSGTAMFRGCRDIVGGNGTKYDAGHTDEGYARIDKAGTPGYLTSSAGTGIFNVEGKAMGDGYFYTPDGRRIEGQPTKQGFYISNGRKVMVK